MSFLFDGIVCWMVERLSMNAPALGEFFMDPPASMLKPPMKLLSACISAAIMFYCCYCILIK